LKSFATGTYNIKIKIIKKKNFAYKFDQLVKLKCFDILSNEKIFFLYSAGSELHGRDDSGEILPSASHSSPTATNLSSKFWNGPQVPVHYGMGCKYQHVLEWTMKAMTMLKHCLLSRTLPLQRLISQIRFGLDQKGQYVLEWTTKDKAIDFYLSLFYSKFWNGPHLPVPVHFWNGPRMSSPMVMCK
jgi:hypothetical protein